MWSRGASRKPHNKGTPGETQQLVERLARNVPAPNGPSLPAESCGLQVPALQSLSADAGRGQGTMWPALSSCSPFSGSPQHFVRCLLSPHPLVLSALTALTYFSRPRSHSTCPFSHHFPLLGRRSLHQASESPSLAPISCSLGHLLSPLQ